MRSRSFGYDSPTCIHILLSCQSVRLVSVRGWEKQLIKQPMTIKTLITAEILDRLSSEAKAVLSHWEENIDSYMRCEIPNLFQGSDFDNYGSSFWHCASGEIAFFGTGTRFVTTQGFRIFEKKISTTC